MNEPSTTDRDAGDVLREEREDVRLHELFSDAGLRPRPPADLERRTRDALHLQWKEMVKVRNRRRRYALGAIAAAVLATVMIVRLTPGPVAPAGDGVATVLRQQGEIRIEPEDSGTREEDARQPPFDAFEGQTLSTASGAFVLLRWYTGENVRVDQDSTMRLLGRDLIELLDGRIYVDRQSDTAASGKGESITVRTTFGRIRHVGTQYMARVTPNVLEVTVREGRVGIASEAVQSTASHGERVTVRPDGSLTVSAVPTFGADWNWAEEIRLPFRLDGRSAHDLIEEIARETGRLVRYESGLTERIAREAVLQGTLDLSPMDALEVVLQASGLNARHEDALILIRAD